MNNLSQIKDMLYVLKGRGTTHFQIPTSNGPNFSVDSVIKEIEDLESANGYHRLIFFISPLLTMYCVLFYILYKTKIIYYEKAFNTCQLRLVIYGVCRCHVGNGRIL